MFGLLNKKWFGLLEKRRFRFYIRQEKVQIFGLENVQSIEQEMVGIKGPREGADYLLDKRRFRLYIYWTREGSDFLTREGSDYWTREGSDYCTREGSDYCTREGSDY